MRYLISGSGVRGPCGAISYVISQPGTSSLSVCLSIHPSVCVSVQSVLCAVSMWNRSLQTLSLEVMNGHSCASARSPHVAGLRVLVEVVEPGLLSLATLCSGDQPVLIKIQTQKHRPSLVSLFGSQHTHKRVLQKKNKKNIKTY